MSACVQGGVTPQAPGYSAAEGDLGQEAGADREAAAPSSAGTWHCAAFSFMLCGFLIALTCHSVTY